VGDLARQAQALGRRPALVLVDMINGFTDPASPLGADSDTVVAACRRLLDAFRSRGLPVCYSTVIYDHRAQAEVFRARLPALNILMRGENSVAVDARLSPQPGEPVFEKQFASVFFATTLAPWLRDADADSLVVTGLTTSGCVRATVVDGLQHGYNVWVPREAVGDRNSAAHAANLHDMHAKYAEVVSTDATLEALEGHA